MGISIRTNGSSNNSCRNLKKTGKKNDSVLEKLASGYRINHAADDASGLGITEKMRAQINALTTVSPGCEDGINLLNTADGYLDEVQNILVRMTELTEKSANGILDDPTDRAALQEEMNQLGAEIDRIADTANFNGNALFSPREVIVHHVNKTTDLVNVTKTVEGTQYFSSPNPNYMNLCDNTLCPDTENDTQRTRGDTLKTLAKAVTDYMSSNGLTSPDMAKGKLYYTADGKTLVDAPAVKTDADIKALLGDPYFSVDTFPGQETQVIHHDAVDFPGKGWHDEVPAHTETIHIAEKMGSYSLNTSEAGKALYAHDDPSRALDVVKNAVDTYKRANCDKYLNELVGKNVYIQKNSYTAVVDSSSNSTNYPSSQWDKITISVSVGHAGHDQTVNVPAKVGYWDEPPYHKDAYDENITTYQKKQSYVDHIDEKQRIIKEWDESTFPPITLQVGETSQKADKLNINLYDIHTDKLFKEVKQLIGYGTKNVIHPEVPPKLDLSSLNGSYDKPTSGSANYTPGQSSYTTKEPDPSKPIYHYDEAIRDNTDHSPYENAVTLDISNQEFAICNVENAREVSNYISLIRGSYGAMLNRLEHTVTNHENTIENMSAAKSRIKDTDMAKMMMERTKNNILQQSAQSMLAQANTQPQSVLSLLQ